MNARRLQRRLSEAGLPGTVTSVRPSGQEGSLESSYVSIRLRFSTDVRVDTACRSAAVLAESIRPGYVGGVRLERIQHATEWELILSVAQPLEPPLRFPPASATGSRRRSRTWYGEWRRLKTFPAQAKLAAALETPYTSPYPAEILTFSLQPALRLGDVERLVQRVGTLASTGPFRW